MRIRTSVVLSVIMMTFTKGVRSNNIDIEREQSAADIIIVVVDATGAPSSGVVDLVEQPLEFVFAVGETFVAEGKKDDEELLFACDVAHRFGTLFGVFNLMPDIKHFIHLHFAKMQMFGSAFEKVGHLGVAHIYFGCNIARGHHIALFVPFGINQTAVVAVNKAVSVDGFGPVDALVAFKVDGDVDFAFGLSESDTFRECRNSKCIDENNSKKCKKDDFFHLLIV